MRRSDWQPFVGGKVLPGQRPGQDQQGNFLSTMLLERACAFIERSARCHDIVDQENALCAQILHAVKGIANVFAAFFPGQARLGRRMPDTLAAKFVEWSMQSAGNRSSKFECLVKTTLLETQAVQGQGNDEICVCIGGFFSHEATEKRTEDQPVLVFECLYQPVEGKVVAEYGDRSVVMGFVR